MEKVLVIGATGNVGSALIEKLTTEGYSVKAATRTPDHYPATASVTAVKFDYSDHTTFDLALEDVKVVEMIALPMDLDAFGKLKPFIDKAKEQGVEHIVFTSAFGANANEEAPLRKVENYLINSGVNYTIVRPNFFMENFSVGFLADQVRNGAIYLAASDGKTSFISVKDIASVAVTAIKEKLYNQEFDLTGPEAFDHNEIVTMINNSIGASVKYMDIPEDTMLQGARDAGLPEDAVTYMGFLYQAVRNGWAAPVTDDIKKVTGNKPVSFKDFIEENKSRWV